MKESVNKMRQMEQCNIAILALLSIAIVVIYRMILSQRLSSIMGRPASKFLM